MAPETAGELSATVFGMRVASLLLGLTLVALVGCGPSGEKAAVTGPAPSLTSNNGRWLATRTLSRTEWTFHEDGTYDALYQEGTVAAQVRGKFKQEGNHLTATPDPGSVDAKSGSKPEEAARVQKKLEEGVDLTLTPSGSGFTGKPADNGEAYKFEPM